MPPFAYYGGKTRLSTRIAAMLPAHEHYVEPFAGSLAVLLAKVPSHMETVNDIDRHLVTFWRVLRDRPNELARVCALTPHSRAEFDQCRAEPDSRDEMETARRVWVILSQGRSGVPRKSTGWRHHVDPGGSRISMPGVLAAYVDRITAVAGRLRSVSLECRPAIELINRYGNHPEVLLYCDPPYLASTRTSTGDYTHEMGTEADHRDLGNALQACQAAVVLSGYDSPLYDELYTGWHRAQIRTGTTQHGRWAPRVEVLWSNRPLREPAETGLFTVEEPEVVG